MSGFYGEVDNAPAGYGQGNQGFSGTPLWKLQQHGLMQRASVRMPPTKEELETKRQQEELQVANVLMEAVSFGALPADCSDKDKAAAKPFVRHVLVKDLRKVATRMKSSLPSTGLFDKNAPVALFALFDGQSCADAKAPGPQAADWCCRHVHSKLIKNLQSLPSDQVNINFLKAILIKTFEDLDHDLLTGNPGIQDGCGAGLALLVGHHLFTAVVGNCGVIYCEPEPPGDENATKLTFRASPLGANQGRCDLPEEKKYLQQRGGIVIDCEGSRGACVRRPTGAVSAVSRSLGDRAWKSIGQENGEESSGLLHCVPEENGEESSGLLHCVPEVHATQVSYADGNPALVLTSAPIAEALPTQTIGNAVAEFVLRPRSASGEIVALASEALPLMQEAKSDDSSPSQQCTAVTVYFQPQKSLPAEESVVGKSATAGTETTPPAAKKPRTGLGKSQVQSLRLRHILVRHRDCMQPFDAVRNRPVTRSIHDAETVLRRALRDLLQEQKDSTSKAKHTSDLKKASMASLQATAVCQMLCKETSECESAVKGGGMCGDLGWVSNEELKAFGGQFTDAVKALTIGQWSDLVPSQHGVHLVQLIA